MPKIVVIDDDYSMELLVESLGFRGYDAYRVKSAAAALQSIDKIVDADLVVLDIIMERPPNSVEPAISGDLTTGMVLFRAIRERNPNIPVLILSATGDQMLIDAVKHTPKTTFLSKWGAPSLSDFLDRIEHLIGGSRQPQLPRSFIVHGHDTAEKLALKNYLQNTLGFPEPTILHEMPNLGRTIIEKLARIIHAI